MSTIITASNPWLPAVQSLDAEVWTLSDLWQRLKAAREGVSEAITVSVAMPRAFRLGAAVARELRRDLETPDDVWAAMENIEPHFFKLVAKFELGGIGGARDVAEGTKLFPLDIAERLEYLDALYRQVDGNTLPGGPLQRRAAALAFLDDPTVPPEIRIVLGQAFLLPTLVVVVGAMSTSATLHPSSQTKALFERTLLEGLDSMIAFFVAAIPNPLPLPTSLEGVIRPMDLATLSEQWDTVRAAWHRG